LLKSAKYEAACLGSPPDPAEKFQQKQLMHFSKTGGKFIRGSI
jgi:hypothetical protein